MSQITPVPIVDSTAGLGRTPHPEIDIVGDEGRDEGLPAAHRATGELLHLLVRATRATRVLEIGTALGYSGLWIATALADDGLLISLERDEARAKRARAHFAAAGVERRTTVMIGDAHRYLHKIAGPFDLIFQDGDTAQYSPMLDRLAGLLRSGGLLVTAQIAHGADYGRRLAGDPRFHTTFLPLGDGVAVAWRTPL